MKRYISLIIIVLGLVEGVGSAQNFDPTVEVTTAYRAGQIDVSKPVIEMAVPDSVTRFAIDFDYSVTSSRYKGSYSFEPYVLNARPVVDFDREKTFSVRVGAGYTLHPTVDFVYTPRINSRSFAMSIYGSHRSFFGKYRSLAATGSGSSSTGSGSASVDGSGSDKGAEIDWDEDDKPKFKGYNSYTDAGIYGRADWQKGYFSFDVGYTGYARKDTTLRRGFDAARAELRFASHNSGTKYFYYDIVMAYMYGEDRVKQRGETVPVVYGNETTYLKEHDITVGASLGSVFSSDEKILVDFGVEFTKYGSYFSSKSGKYYANPKYIVRNGRIFANLGVLFTRLIRDDDTVWPEDDGYSSAAMHKTKGQSVYPDVEFGVDIVSDYLNMYVKATGGDEINRYSSMVEQNPWMSLNFAQNYAGMPLINNTIERFNASLGFRGNIASRFTFDLRGGYARYSGMMLDAVVMSSDAASGTAGAPLLPTVSYAHCNYWYAALDMGWHSRDVTASASLAFNDTDVVDKGRVGFELAPFTAGFDIVYNWKRRVYIGLHGEGATARDGYAAVLSTSGSTSSTAVTSTMSVPADLQSASLTRGDLLRIPGYFDLGLSAEYRFSHSLSFWVYGSNLLDQTIQRSPLYATSGISVTAGIALSF